MKKHSKKLFALICFTSVLFFVAANASTAQVSTKAGKQSIRQFLLEKQQKTPFTLSPAKHLPEFLNNSLDPCTMASPADIGQSIGNALNNTDCQLDDGSWADFYTFNGVQGQQVVITMSSSSVDSYLGLANESGTFVVEDDDGGGGLTARIAVTLPETGVYIILANTALPNQFGGYLLVINGAQPCTFTVSPAATVPAEGGTFTFTVTTQPECYWQAYSFNTYATTNSRGRGNGTVTYTVLQNGSGSTRAGSIGVSSFPTITFTTSFSFTQPSVACSYSLNPSSLDIPATQTSGSFQIVAPAGCPWTAQSNYSIINVSSSGTGTGTINFTIQHNNGAARTATITVAGQTLTINQAGLNCTYSISPRQLNVGRAGGSGVLYLDTQPNCTWFATTHVEWINIPTGPGSGARAISYTVSPFTEPNTRSGAITISFSLNSVSQSLSVWFDQTGTFNNPEFDFDGNGKSDLVVFRPGNRTWYTEFAPGVITFYVWGQPTDKLVPADYDGNGRTDYAVFRPADGSWHVLMPGLGGFSAVFGASGDIPVPADYDGDGRADLAVYRPSIGTWFIQRSSDSQFVAVQFGIEEDVPTRGDFDGDKKADIAVFRPSTGNWFRLNSSNGTFSAQQFGISEDKPVAADYDGDGKTDIAVWRPSDRHWYRLNSSNGTFSAVQFGLSDDLPVLGDYDGDRKADIGVFRPSTRFWYFLNSTSGFAFRHYGDPGDIPIPNSFIR